MDRLTSIGPKQSMTDIFVIFTALDTIPDPARRTLALAQAFLEACNATGTKPDVLLQVAGRTRQTVTWEREKNQQRAAYDWARGELGL